MQLRAIGAVITMTLSLMAVSYVLIGGNSTASPVSADEGTQSISTAQNTCINVLVFSKTAVNTYRHESIDEGIAAFQAIAAERGWSVTATEDAGAFSSGNLANYDVVVFLMTTGDILDGTQQTAFEGYIQSGGGYFGVHSASDTEYNWPWYGGLIGAYFSNHPDIQEADVLVEDTAHVSTEGMPNPWTRTDEWYNFQSNPRPDVNVTLLLDESTYSGGTMGEDHPLAWYHEYDGGRSYYTAMGHTEASYSDATFRDHLQGATEWAANVECDDLAPMQPASNLSNGGSLSSVPVKPTYSWSHPNEEETDTAGDWYQIATLKDGVLFYQGWFDGSEICSGTTCTAQPLAEGQPGLGNGDYEWWVEAYRLSDGNRVWSTTSASFTVDKPDPLTSISATSGQVRPTVSWEADTYLDWFAVYIGNPVGAYFLDWFPADEICDAGDCSVTPQLNLVFLTGGHQVWMQAWSELDGFTEWIQADNVTLASTPAGLPTNLNSPNPTDANPTVQWQAGANSSWFEVYVARPGANGGPWTVYDLDWFDAADIGCPNAGNTCSVPDQLNGVLDTGEWSIYVRAWGSGGFSEGGVVNGFAEGSFTH